MPADLLPHVLERAVDESTLRAWIRDYRIWWEVLPLIEIHAGRATEVGFEFHLYGRHPRSGTGPGCPECHHLHEKLALLATSVVPQETRPSRCQIEPFHPAFYAGAGGCFDVRTTLRILHREGHFDPVDRCEVRCRNEIQDRLRALGAPRDGWDSPSRR